MNKNIKNLLSAAAVSLSLLGMASCTGDLDVKPIDPNMNTQQVLRQLGHVRQ